MLRYTLVIGIFFALLLSLVLITRCYRRFAVENPDLGPFREVDKCMGCAAAGKDCDDGTCDGH